MKKTLLILLLVGVLCSFLTGCVAGIYEITINSDSTVDVYMQTGISENGLNSMAAASGEKIDTKDMTLFTYNGKNYYGEVTNQKYNSLDEFNKSINESNQANVDTGLIKVAKNSDGNYVLTVEVTNDTADTTEIEANMDINGVEKTVIDRLMNEMVMLFTFRMPENVVQTAGSKKGITVSGNKVVIDFLKLDVPVEENKTIKYTFTTQKGAVQPPVQISTQKFTDVPESLWSYKAINKLADGGLVAGVGEGRFSPERGMKISEFCQVLVNATGLESGPDESGYWAAKAIKSCIDKGYIYSHGEINMENYDAVITREEAIAAMQLASGREPIAGKNIQLSDIPDGTQISDRYKELVLQAYNSGITTGVNDQLKFSPQNKLTRGQVCQLFYNVNWTTKL